MAQRSSRKRRKERQRARTGGGTAAPAAEHESDADQLARGYARGRAKDDAARAALKPLAEGERPTAVTVAAIVAALLGIGNIIAVLAGMEINGEKPNAVGPVMYSVVMFVAAWGCWNVRYWAVLGMEALLGLAILLFSIFLVGANNALAVIVCLAVIGSAGALFWFLVKSMARIQMPERPGAR